MAKFLTMPIKPLHLSIAILVILVAATISTAKDNLIISFPSGTDRSSYFRDKDIVGDSSGDLNSAEREMNISRRTYIEKLTSSVLAVNGFLAKYSGIMVNDDQFVRDKSGYLTYLEWAASLLKALNGVPARTIPLEVDTSEAELIEFRPRSSIKQIINQDTEEVYEELEEQEASPKSESPLTKGSDSDIKLWSRFLVNNSENEDAAYDGVSSTANFLLAPLTSVNVESVAWFKKKNINMGCAVIKLVSEADYFSVVRKPLEKVRSSVQIIGFIETDMQKRPLAVKSRIVIHREAEDPQYNLDIRNITALEGYSDYVVILGDAGRILIGTKSGQKYETRKLIEQPYEGEMD